MRWCFPRGKHPDGPQGRTVESAIEMARDPAVLNNLKKNLMLWYTVSGIQYNLTPNETVVSERTADATGVAFRQEKKFLEFFVMKV